MGDRSAVSSVAHTGPTLCSSALSAWRNSRRGQTFLFRGVRGEVSAEGAGCPAKGAGCPAEGGGGGPGGGKGGGTYDVRYLASCRRCSYRRPAEKPER